MGRRVARLVNGLYPLGGLSLVVAGMVAMGFVLRLYAQSHRAIETIDWLLPTLVTSLGAMILLICVYERRLSDGAEDEDEEGPRDEAPPPTPGTPRKPSRTDRLLQARDFLPLVPPEGWSIPLAVGGSFRWMFDTKTECVALTIERKRGLTGVKVFIAGKGTMEPVSDARCSEILGHMRHVGEFFEADPDKDHPAVRLWFAVPEKARPSWPVPKSIPPPRERVLSPHLVAARKYLPQRLPQGWSVPIAIGDDHGTEWKDGAWMIATSDDWFMVVFLVTSRGRVKLSVTFFGGDGDEVSEGAAAEMLRHFRGVLEFAQTEVTEGTPEAVATRTYLGELAPEGGARVMLN